MEAVNEAEDDEHTDEDEDAVILPLSWLNNIQERGRIRYLHVHPSRTKNLFSISEGKPHTEASEESEELALCGRN